MQKRVNEQNTKALWILIVAAVIIRIMFQAWPLITGVPEVDGLFAVFFGFYICSKAAANFLNLILYELNTRRLGAIIRIHISWLGLNVLVMLSGLMLVVIGIYRFFINLF